MDDLGFYGIAALIGFVGAVASQVLTLQKSLQIRAQTGNLEDKKSYCDSVITRLNQQLDNVEGYARELEKKTAEAKDTAEDKTESQYKAFRQGALEDRKKILDTIATWAKQRGELINDISSARQANFLSPYTLAVMNIFAGALIAWLVGFIEVQTRGSGQVLLTLNLIIELLFAGAFWPLIWERVFNTGAVQERLNSATARFGMPATTPPATAGGSTAPPATGSG